MQRLSDKTDAYGEMVFYVQVQHFGGHRSVVNFPNQHFRMILIQMFRVVCIWLKYVYRKDSKQKTIKQSDSQKVKWAGTYSIYMIYLVDQIRHTWNKSAEIFQKSGSWVVIGHLVWQIFIAPYHSDLLQERAGVLVKETAWLIARKQLQPLVPGD